MDFLRRFMAGRYGNDQLNAALLVLGLVLIVIEMVTGWGWMGMFILALLICATFVCFRAIFRPVTQRIKSSCAGGARFQRACIMPACGSLTVRHIGTLNAPTASSACVCRAEEGRSILPVRTAIHSLCARVER